MVGPICTRASHAQSPLFYDATWQDRYSKHLCFTTAGVDQGLGQRQGRHQLGSLLGLVGMTVPEGVRVGQAGAGWGQGSLAPSSPVPGTEGVSGTAWGYHVT